MRRRAHGDGVLESGKHKGQPWPGHPRLQHGIKVCGCGGHVGLNGCLGGDWKLSQHKIDQVVNLLQFLAVAIVELGDLWLVAVLCTVLGWCYR